MPISLELEAELRRYMVWYTNHLAEQGIRMRGDFTLFPPRVRNSIELSGGEFQLATGTLNHTAQMTNPRVALLSVLKRAGYTFDPKDREGWHTLRRSGSRAAHDALSDKGLDQATRIIQAMLGHESATTTERYLGIELDRHMRDKLIKGKSLFGGLAEEGKVVPLRRVEGE